MHRINSNKTVRNPSAFTPSVAWDFTQSSGGEVSETSSVNSYTSNDNVHPWHYFQDEKVAQFLNQYGFANEQDILNHLQTLGFSDELLIRAANNFLKNISIIAHDRDFQSLYSRFGFEPTVQAQHDIFLRLETIKENLLQQITRSLLSPHQKVFTQLLERKQTTNKLISAVVELCKTALQFSSYADVLYLMQATANFVGSKEKYALNDSKKRSLGYMLAKVKQEYCEITEETLKSASKQRVTPKNQKTVSSDQQSLLRDLEKPTTKPREKATTVSNQTAIPRNLNESFSKLFRGESSTASKREKSHRYTTRVEFLEDKRGDFRFAKVTQ